MPNKSPAYAPFFVMSPQRLSIFGPKTQLPKLSRVIPVSEKQEPSGLGHGFGHGLGHGFVHGLGHGLGYGVGHGQWAC